jgi:hypothetical protein
MTWCCCLSDAQIPLEISDILLLFFVTVDPLELHKDVHGGATY